MCGPGASTSAPRPVWVSANWASRGLVVAEENPARPDIQAVSDLASSSRAGLDTAGLGTGGRKSSCWHADVDVSTDRDPQSCTPFGSSHNQR